MSSEGIKKIAVLGSTGSIGQQTLDVVRALPRKFQIIGLAAGENTKLLAEQISEFKPAYICCQGKDAQTHLPASGHKISLEEMAVLPEADIIVIATPGQSGLEPLLAAVRAGKKIALANKESLVTAGDIITSEAKKNGAQILPVDSEHSAIWQCLNGEIEGIARIILTASGGPFLRYTPARLEQVTVEQALKHPSWKMGKKVTIDSATLMNKGLEIIEAHWLFHMPYNHIDVIIHPQSIVHSMVEFIDGSIKAQMGKPDMRLPIQYALSYPERIDNPQLPRIDWSKISSLTFEPPNPDTFPCLNLAREAGARGGTYPAVLCAADEAAVDLFLSGRIKFTSIAHLVEKTLEQHVAIANPVLKDILAAAMWAKETVKKLGGGEII